MQAFDTHQKTELSKSNLRHFYWWSCAAKYILTRTCSSEMASAGEFTCVSMSKAKEGKVPETFCHTNQPTSAAISTQRDLTPDTWTWGQEKCSLISFVS